MDPFSSPKADTLTMDSHSNQHHYTVLSKEPTSTPDLIPLHLKRLAVAQSPIIEIVHRFISQLRPNSGTELERLVALIALVKVVSPVWSRFKKIVLKLFASRISIPETDPVAQEIMQWISAEVIDKSLSTSATVVSNPTASLFGGRTKMGLQNSNYQLRLDHERHEETQIQCLPPVGKKIFWVGWRPFLFSRSVRPKVPSPPQELHFGPHPRHQESIVLYTPGWSLDPLVQFAKSCRSYKEEKLTGMTTVYYSLRDPYGSGLWSSVVKTTRKLDTIDMDETQKTLLVDDAENYFSEHTKKFYSDCGIPYRRGYLFHGPPGTGKTSFSAALAGHLGYDLYLINLATGDMSDGSLQRLFLSLPPKCVVVIEDIDSCGIGREQGSALAGPGFTMPVIDAQNNEYPTGSRAHSSRKQNLVTLSGLLNAIDGSVSAEGRLLIMTSNHALALDPALTRPGRVDLIVPFGRMKEQSIRDIFKRLVGRAAIAHLGFTEQQIDEYATIFSAIVPPNTFTPAQLQGFLQNCRGNPETAMKDINAWVQETIDQAPEIVAWNSVPFVPPYPKVSAMANLRDVRRKVEEAAAATPVSFRG